MDGLDSRRRRSKCFLRRSSLFESKASTSPQACAFSAEIGCVLELPSELDAIGKNNTIDRAAGQVAEELAFREAELHAVGDEVHALKSVEGGPGHNGDRELTAGMMLSPSLSYSLSSASLPS